MTRNKLYFSNKLTKETGINFYDMQIIVQKFLDSIIETLVNGDDIIFKDFGTFKIYYKKERMGRNPKKPSIPAIIGERNYVRFKAGRLLKRLVREKTRKVEPHGKTKP